MKIRENVLLSELTTMRIGGAARYVAEVSTKTEVAEAAAWAAERQLDIFVLGEGTNVLAGEGFEGLVILNKIWGFSEILEGVFEIGAGEVLDDICERTAVAGWTGMECMSGIPGTVGAAPVQNSGAYGQELLDVLVEINAYDLHENATVVIRPEEAKFGYRSSIFKNPEERRYIITSVIVRLRRGEIAFDDLYFSIRNYMTERGLTDTSPAALRENVLAIRAVKIPSVMDTATAGSFFKNPILTGEEAVNWAAKYPEFSFMKLPGGAIRVFAGWLLDNAGLKGYSSHGMKLYEKNALIGVNVSAKDLNDVDAFTEDVVGKIFAMYGLRLEREPDVLK